MMRSRWHAPVLAIVALAAMRVSTFGQPGGGQEISAGDCHIGHTPDPATGLYVVNLWPGGVVPFEFDAGVTPANQLKALAAMATLEAACEVDFVPRHGQADFVDIRNGTSNFSSRIGRAGGEQYITILIWDAHLVIVHELMHVLGAWHEQQRADRDAYVTINYANIPANRLSDFDTRPGTVYGRYDFESVMHYNRLAATSNGQPTIEPRPEHARWKYRLGEMTRLSTGDIWLLTEMYGGPRPPGVFDLLSPNDSATTGPGWSPQFSWSDAELADSYRLRVDDDPYFSSPAIDVTLAGTSYVGGSLATDRVYYWTITAANENGETQAWHTPVARFYNGTSVPAQLHVDNDAPPGGDGTSWGTAFSELPQALDLAACAGGAEVEIRVGQGIYYPDRGSGDRFASFALRSNVTVRGGYAGYGDADPDARNPSETPTHLSGDLAGDGGADCMNVADNSIHVVRLAGQRTGPVTLDGVTISYGHPSAAQPLTTGSGGGLWADDCDLRLIDCTFYGSCASIDGGGAFVQASTLHAKRCTFSRNHASSTYGGVGAGLAAFGCDAVTLKACRFVDNQAAGGGGAFLRWSAASIEHVDWLTNIASQRPGGGLWLVQCVPVTIAKSTFCGNDALANSGGGAAVAFDSVANFDNCRFSANRRLNAAVAPGGALWVGNGVGGPSSATLTSCTFNMNTSAGGGGAIGVSTASSVVGSNCILYDDSPTEVALSGTSTASFTYSTVEGGWPGAGNLAGNPLFADADGADNLPGTPDDDLRLTVGSPCIDSGDPAYALPVATDLDGLLRVWDGNSDAVARVDMGTYEFGSHGAGDVNCDGAVDFFDIDPFLLALFDPVGYVAANPACSLATADISGDGGVDFFDIDPFVTCIFDACP